MGVDKLSFIPLLFFPFRQSLQLETEGTGRQR